MTADKHNLSAPIEDLLNELALSHPELILLWAEKMRQVAAVAAGVAHEINNPLSGIMQATQLLTRGLDMTHPRTKDKLTEFGFSEAEQQKLQQYIEQRGLLTFTDMIQDCGTRTGELVSDFLRYARRAPLKEQPVELTSLLEQTLKLVHHDGDLRRLEMHQSVEVTTDFRDGLVEVLGDRVMMQQALIGVLRLSFLRLHRHWKSVPEFSPELRMTVFREANQSGVVWISDNSPELSLAQQQRLLPPDSQPLKPQGELWFGYAISRRIVEKIGNGRFSMSCQSGNRIEIEWPLASSQEGNLE